MSYDGLDTLIDAIHSERECMNMLEGKHPTIHGPRIGYDAAEIEEEREWYARALIQKKAPTASRLSRPARDFGDEIPF